MSEQALFKAIECENIDAVRRILEEENPDVNAQLDWKARPLNMAAQKGNIEIVDCLIEHGADINAQGNAGYTPLISAVTSFKPKMVKHLVEKGAQIDVRDKNQITALMHAASDNKSYVEDMEASMEIARFLISKGANTRARTSNGSTLMELSEDFSTMNRYLKSVVPQWVQENGRPPYDGYTPFLKIVQMSASELAAVKEENPALLKDVIEKRQLGDVFDQLPIPERLVFYKAIHNDISAKERAKIEKMMLPAYEKLPFQEKIVIYKSVFKELGDEDRRQFESSMMQEYEQLSYQEQMDVYKSVFNELPREERQKFEDAIRNSRFQDKEQSKNANISQSVTQTVVPVNKEQERAEMEKDIQKKRREAEMRRTEAETNPQIKSHLLYENVMKQMRHNIRDF